MDEELIDGTVVDIVKRLDDKLRTHNHTSVDFTSAAGGTTQVGLSDRCTAAVDPECGASPQLPGHQCACAVQFGSMTGLKS